METPISEQDIEYAETYLAAGDISTASQMLERYLELAEEYIAEECQATDEVQYFSFQDSFERLCYARVSTIRVVSLRCRLRLIACIPM